MKQVLSFLFTPLVTLALVLVSSSSASAQTTTWTGTGIDWNTAADWTSGVPVSGGTAQFSSAGNSQLTVTLSAASAVQNIQFEGGNQPTVGNYIIGTTTGNVITLTSGGNIGYDSYVYTGQTETINAPLVISGSSGSSYNFQHTGPYGSIGSSIIYNGTITGAATATNTTTLNMGNADNTFNGVIGDGSGGGQLAINVNGGGTQTFAGINTYTGSTTLNYNSNATLDVTGSLGNTAIYIYGGPSGYGPGSTLNLQAAGAVSQNVITANSGTLRESVDNAITGTTTLNITSGAAYLTNANNYTGPTNVSGGYYDVNNPRTPNLILTGTLGNTAVTVNEADNFPGYLELNGAGGISQNVLTINGGQVTQGVAGAITGTTTVKINESNSGAYGTIGTAYFGNGNTYTGVTTLDGSNSNVTLNITSLANGGSPSSIGASSSAASNLIFSGGILQATTLTSAQSTDRLFTLGDSSTNGNSSNSSSAILDSSSSNPAYTLSFTNTGAIISGLVNGEYAATPGIILTGSNTGANLFAPYLGDVYNPQYNTPLTLTKSGAGNWIVSNANTFTGNTNLNGGTLQLNNPLAVQFSQVNFNSTNGLTFGSSGTYTAWAILGSSNESLPTGVAIQVGEQAGILYNQGNTYTYSGILSGGGGITEQGLSNQDLSANNTYTGPTTVNSSTLQADNPASTTPFGTGSVDLNGGRLAFVPTGNGSTLISETIASSSGAVLNYGGNGALYLNQGSNSGGLKVTVGDGTDPGFVRSGKGTLIIETNSADLGSGENVVLAGSGNTVPTLHGIVSPTIVGMNGSTFYGNYVASSLDFLTYGGSYTGFGVATYSNHSSNFAPTTGEIANITSSVSTTASGNPYALRVAQNQTLVIGNGTTLTVGDGTNPAAVILNSTGSYGPQNMIFNNYGGSNGVLNFGTSEGLVYVTNWAGISPVITGSGGLTISGIGQQYSGVQGGALTLQNASNSFTGGITVNSGGVLAYAGDQNENSNGTLGDVSNTITLNGGGISSNNTVFGIGRSVVMTSLGGAFGTYSATNVAANISGSGLLTMGSYQTYGNDPFNYGNNLVALTGNNSYTGGTLLYNNYLVVSATDNLGAATSPVIFDGGILSIAGTTMQNFGTQPVTFVPTNNVSIDIQNINNTFTLSKALDQGAGGLIKAGQGTLVLTGANSYTGTTELLGGVLKVDSSQGGSLNSVTSLYFVGGTLDLFGSGSTTVQSVGNVTMGQVNATSDATTGGDNRIIVDNNGGNATLNIGTLPTAPANNGQYNSNGTTLAFIATGSGTSTITATTAPASTTNIYGGRFVYATLDSSGNVTSANWATSTSPGPVYTISGYSNYTDFDPGNVGGPSDFANLNILLDATNSGYFTNGDAYYQNETPNSLKIDANSTTNTVLDLSGFKLTLNSGGLLMTGGNNFTIQNGTIISGLVGSTLASSGTQQNSGPTVDLVVQQYGTGTLTIAATIPDVSNAITTLTKSGPGTLILTGANTFSGQTFVNGGVLSVSSLSNLGFVGGTVSGLTSSTSSNQVSYNGSALPGHLAPGSTLLGQTIGYIGGQSGNYTFYLNGNANAALSNGSAVFTPGGGNINLNGGTLQVSGSLNVPTIYLGSDGGSLDAINGSTITLINSPQTFVGGGHTSTGGLTINSSDNSNGVVFLNYNGYNNYGGITINGGILRLGSNTAIGNGPANYLSFGSTSTGHLQLNGNSAYVAGLSSTSSNAVVENGNGSGNNVTLGVVNGDNETYAGVIKDTATTGTGKLSLLKAGGGSLSLTNPNSTYSGTTDIVNSTLNVASVANGGSPSSIGAPTNAASNLLFGGGTLQYTGSATQTTDRLFTMGDSYSNAATIDASGSGASATLSFTNTGAIAFANAGARNLTLTGTNTGLNTLAAALGDSTYNSTVYPTSLIKTGAGTWEVSGASSYSGGTTVQAGTLAFSNVGTAPTVQALGTGRVTLDNATTLQYLGSTSTLGTPITVASNGSATIANNASGVLTLGGAISKDNSTLNISGGKFVIAGGLTGPSAHSDVNYVGGSTTGITNVAGTYNGPTSISGGSTVLAGINDALADTHGGASTNTDLTLGAASDGAVTNTFDLLGNNQTVASLTSLGTGTNQVISGNGVASTDTTSTGPSTTTGNLTINYTNTSSADTFGGSLGGSGTSTNFGLTKSGAGNLILTGASTYTGGTTVSAGTLTASNTTGSATGTGPVTVTGTGKLTGDGTISGGLSVGSGTTLTPGSSTPTLGLTLATSSNNILTAQSLTVAGGATLSFQLNSTINFVGNNSANPSGSTLINDLGVFDYTGTGAVTLNFNNTGEGGDVGHPNVYSLVEFLATGSNVNTSDFSITGLLGDEPDTGSFLTIVPLTGSPGVDVLQLNAVPEPSTWAMLLGGLALLVVYHRRQRKDCRA